LIRIAITMKDNRSMQFIVYGKDYADIKNQIDKFYKSWKKDHKNNNVNAKDRFIVLRLDERAFD